MKVAALLLLLISAASVAQAPPGYARESFKGTGFTIALPQDVVVNLAPTEELPHGFGLDLLRPGIEHEWERHPLRYLGFTTRWDAGDLPSLNAVVEDVVRNLDSTIPAQVQGSGTIRLVSSFPAKLGELPAKRLVIEFTNTEKRPAIREMVIAYRSRPDASGIIYIASLTTTRVNFQEDLNLFAKLLAGFKLTVVE
jgi:hypothetical protein